MRSWRVGLFLKFFLSIALLVVFTSSVLGYFLIQNEIARIKADLKQRGIELSQNLAYDSEYGVLVRNERILKENMERTMMGEDVIYTIVHERGGSVLAVTEGDIGIPIPDDERGDIEKAAVNAEAPVVRFYRSEIFDEPIYDIAAPIMIMREERRREEIGFPVESGEYMEKAGVVRVGLSLVRMNDTISGLVRLAHIVTAGVILIGIFVAALLVGVITRPLRTLISGMVKVAAGELEQVKVTSSDEIGELTSAFNRMVGEIDRYRKGAEGYRKTLEDKVGERTREAHQFKTYSENIITAMAEGLVAVDGDGVIEMSNRTLEDLTGFSEKELVGKRFVPKLFPGRDRELAIDCLERVRKEGRLKDVDIVLNAKGGSEIPVNFNGALLKGIGGNIQGMVIVLHDMRKEKEAERIKSEFISTISHELRTPLTSIEGFVSLILNKKAGSITEKQEEFLKTVKSQGNHLKELIQNLLDFSRMVTGKMEINKKEMSVKDVIDDVVKAMGAQLAQKDINIKVKIDRGLPEINADPDKIGMLFSNILGNAVKFTGSGGEIKVNAVVSGEDVKVSVADTGIGIARENLEKIFERFYQIDSSLTRKVGGAGVGLAIAREVAQAHGGKVWAESGGPGKGTTVIFTIPVG